MATHINGFFPEDLRNSINSRKLLVVGAGGIGCELLKNLVLTGFEDLEVIDLDTIDVSNLNRQFLFHKQHVGKSKSRIARESALNFNPKSNIIAYHDSIITPNYGVTFYKRFDLVLNALDNKTARNHVNRMCLAAEVPLVESGTAGYLGQVTVIKKGITECYECQPKPVQKTYPGCTIRNTPSEPIHCIVWAKHLFNQLFGEADADEDVSPDSADPELSGDAGKTAIELNINKEGNIERVSTRSWAQSHQYNPEKLFNKLFKEDIQYLLSMDKLWQKRRAPTPLDWFSISSSHENVSVDNNLIKDQRPWTLSDCCQYFVSSIKSLQVELEILKKDDHLVWDKDDEHAMDFVTACTNIRAYIFGIAQKTRFDVKSMAGNIIPAIATTNAVIAGLIVLQAMKILNKEDEECRTVYMNRKPNPRKRLLVPCLLDKPNPKCYVCSEKPEVSVQLNVERITVKMLEEKILKSALNMVAPDVEIMDGKGTILVSSEPGETECNNDKFLKDFNIMDGSRLSCDDFLQDYNLCITILHCDDMKEGEEFNVVGDAEKLKAEQEAAAAKAQENSAAIHNSGESPNISAILDDVDDIECLDDVITTKKRKIDNQDNIKSKKQKIDIQNSVEVENITDDKRNTDGDVIII